MLKLPFTEVHGTCTWLLSPRYCKSRSGRRDYVQCLSGETPWQFSVRWCGHEAFSATLRLPKPKLMQMLVFEVQVIKNSAFPLRSLLHVRAPVTRDEQSWLISTQVVDEKTQKQHPKFEPHNL